MNRLQNFALLFLLSACFNLSARAADPVAAMRSDLAQIFSDPRLVDAQLGVEVFSADRDEVLFASNSQKLLVPASNNKILTAAAALISLGPDYRFKTHVLADGLVSDGVLKGDLIVVGFGDPSSSSRIPPKDPFRAFRDWAAKLKQSGIMAIAGSLIGDGGAFEETERGHGWAWDDLPEGYAAPISALQFNENLLELEIKPGMKAGSPAFLRASPLPDYLNLDSRVMTEQEDIAAKIGFERGRNDEAVVVRGVLPFRSGTLTRTVSVEFPTLYYLSALKYILAQEGIDVSNCEIRQRRNYRPASSSLLWTYASAPLSELLVPMMKMSLNLSAESFTRVLGLEMRGEGTFSKGKEVVEEALAGMGLNKEAYAYADGSGLSRLNLVSADALVHILRFMNKHPYFPAFYSALPIAGIDGTLESKMRRTRAANNVHAKTGSFANVAALSGYVQTADKEMLIFSILANNFIGSRDAVDRVQGKTLARLAAFSRKMPKISLKGQDSKVRSKRSLR
jgi:D-alanyl-D-alanine carboxypeptidase/D-alanyl-D-alanine-endopeptidase (penicillin-binding protein 4)